MKVECTLKEINTIGDIDKMRLKVSSYNTGAIKLTIGDASIIVNGSTLIKAVEKCMND